MRKTIVAIFAIFAVAALAASGWAEYGTWKELYALPGQPGFSNAAFLGISAGDINTLYTAGLQQTGGSSMASGWKSADGGSSWNPIREVNISNPDSCDMLNFFNITMGVASTGPSDVQYLVFGPDPTCAKQHPFPACLFICMLDMITMVDYSTDGGSTFNTGTITPTTPMDNYTVMRYVDQNNGFMAGAPQLLARTQDGGHTWVKIKAPGNANTSFNDLGFADADNGFVVSGDPEPTPSADAVDASDPQSALDFLAAVRDRLVALKNPVSRLLHREFGDAPKGTNGFIWRTTDGGQSWDQVFSKADESFLNIHVVNAETAWVLGEPHTAGRLNFTLWKTADGGDTWTDYSSHVPNMTIPQPSYTVDAFTFSPNGQVGFLGGAAGNNLVYKSLIYYTADGGETWAIDQSVENWGHPILAFAYADAKHAWSAGMDLSCYGYTQKYGGPNADAGKDQTVPSGAIVTLDGSGSNSPDGLPLTYQWTQTAGPTMKLSKAASDKANFVAGAEGDKYTFMLTVNDGQSSASATTMVTVSGTVDDDVAPDDDSSPDDDDDASPSGTTKTTTGCGC